MSVAGLVLCVMFGTGSCPHQCEGAIDISDHQVRNHQDEEFGLAISVTRIDSHERTTNCPALRETIEL